MSTTTASLALADVTAGLGALVWWTLAETRIAPSALRAILSSEGADPSIVPDILPSAALRRAAREWSQGRGNAARYRAEVAAESTAEVVIGILRREQVGAAEVRWVQVDLVVFDLASLAWIVAGTTPEAASFLTVADDRRRHLDHAFIRPEVIQRGLTEAKAASLRDRGGVYYVPTATLPILDRLARIVERIGGSHLDVVHVAATSSSQASIVRGASGAVRDDLGALVERIKGWSESARRVPASQSDALLADLAELKDRADLYADALQVGLGDIAEAIASARTEAVRILDVQTALPVTAPRDGTPRSTPITARGLRAADGLSMKVKEARALATMTAEKFTIAAGSTILVSANLPSMVAARASGLADGSLTADGAVLVLTRDMDFASPSTAGAFVYGKATNGWKAWRTADGTPIGGVDEPTDETDAPAADPLPAAPEVPSEPVEPVPAPSPAPEPDVAPEAPAAQEPTVEADGLADLRELLAEQSPADLRAAYHRRSGQPAPSGWLKPKLVEALLALSAE